MKNSVIVDIFNGFKGHRDTIAVPKENGKNRKMIVDYSQELKEKLSPELFELHQKYEDALLDLWGDEVNWFFAEGFKLGLRIGIECMEE